MENTEAPAARQRVEPTVLLGILGVVAIIIGAIIAILSNNALAHQSMVDDYAVALGMTANDNAVAQAQLGIYVGWGFIIAGAVMLIAMLIVRAAKSH